MTTATIPGRHLRSTIISHRERRRFGRDLCFSNSIFVYSSPCLYLCHLVRLHSVSFLLRSELLSIDSHCERTDFLFFYRMKNKLHVNDHMSTLVR